MDDFTKSMGKQMNLVIKRMEETKKVRMRLREKQVVEEEERFRRREVDEKIQLERISRNKQWRQKKKPFGFYDDWDSNRKGNRYNLVLSIVCLCSKCIEWMLRSELKCSGCGEEMAPPLKIFQCQLGHSQCQRCQRAGDKVAAGNYHISVATNI